MPHLVSVISQECNKYQLSDEWKCLEHTISLALRTLFHILTSPNLGYVPQSMEYYSRSQPHCCCNSHCCCNLHFLDDIWYGALSHMLICHLCIFFDEVSVEIFDPFYSWVFLIVKSSLYILDNSPLSDVSFANIFSHSVAFLLIFLVMSFTEQKFLILIKSSYQLFLSWIVSLMYLKRYHRTQGHLGCI